jgi:BMFP domain-containing protein YqiC
VTRNRSSSIRRATTAALVLLAVAGCRNREDVAAAERLVRAYDRAVIEAHLTRSMDPLEKLTSRDEYDRLQITLVGMSARHELLRSSLESLEIRSASFDKKQETGVAVADERWTYERVDSNTGEVRLAKTEARYRLKYEFKRKGGAWVVDKVRHESAPVESKR